MWGCTGLAGEVLVVVGGANEGSGVIGVELVVGEELTAVPQLARKSRGMAMVKFLMILLNTNSPASLPFV